MLKLIFDFGTLLICAEGARLLENAIAFSSCVGRFEEVNQCPAGGFPVRLRKAKRLEHKSTAKFNRALF
jgi:hypothetical protein